MSNYEKSKDAFEAFAREPYLDNSAYDTKMLFSPNIHHIEAQKHVQQPSSNISTQKRFYGKKDQAIEEVANIGNSKVQKNRRKPGSDFFHRRE